MTRKAKTATGMALALGLWLIWELSPIRAIVSVANLSDPTKLATLAPRGANPRLNKIVYWLDQSERRFLSAETAVNAAQTLNVTREPRASLVKESLLRNLKIARELGLLTKENRERLRRGQAAVVTRGPYSGSDVEIDHIVPISLAPEAGNELANLEMLPEPLNRKKSNRIGDRQRAHAKRLRDAGLLSQTSFDRVMSAKR
ncbi:MAG: hypothetical protein AB1813_17130 [Verrucomicrobiota bacterium]